MSTASSRARRGLAALLVLASVAGCGPSRPPTYPASGVVRYADGDPVRSGYVELAPVTGGASARGKIDPLGRFVLGTYDAQDGAHAGDYVALVTQHVRPLGPEQARELGPDHAEHAGADRRVSLKHASRQDSGLRCTVSETAANEFVLEVEAHRLPGG